MARASTKPTVYPVTLKQEHQLNISTHPDCVPELSNRWLLPNAHLVEPNIDLRRLRRAVDKLRQRHDLLRLKFSKVKGDWRAFIYPPGEDIVQVIDLGDMDDEAFATKISELTNAQMRLVDQYLFEVLVAKCGKRGDVLIVRLNHAITDGYGLLVLVEDLTKYLIGMPILGKAVTFQEYLTRFQIPPPGKAASYDAFWKDLHKDLPKAPNVGRKGKGLEPNPLGVLEFRQQQIDVTASPESIKRFEARAKKHNISPTTMIFSAHLEALCACYNLDRLTFMTHITRTDPALDSYVGDHTLDVVLPFTAQGGENLVQSSKAVGSLILNAISHLPSDTARRRGPYQIALFEAGCYPDQFSVYQPRAFGRQNKSMFREGFNAELGVPQKLGPYTITHLDTAKRRRSSMEMQFSLGHSANRTGFTIFFDGIGYTGDEMRTLCRTTCDFLELEQTKVSVW